MLEEAMALSYDYVRLNYIVKRISARLNNPPASIFTYVKNCNYEMFGIPEENIAIMEGNDREQLLSLYASYVMQLDLVNGTLFHLIDTLDMQQKRELSALFQEKVRMYSAKALEQSNRYCLLVLQIQEKVALQEKEDLFPLCLFSKSLYSSCYEFQSMSRFYSNLASYLSGMIKLQPLK